MGLRIIFLLRCKTVIYFEVNIGLLGPHEYWLVILGLRTSTVLERCDYFVLLLLHKKNTSIIKCIVQDILRGMFFTGFNKQMFPMIVAFNAHHAKFLTNSVFPHGYN